MLPAIVPLLLCPNCRRPDAALSLHPFSDGAEGHVADGVIVCDGCGGWCPIEHELLEWVPRGLLDPKELGAFAARFRSELGRLGLTTPDDAKAAAAAEQFDPQIKQRKFFDDFAEGDNNYFAIIEDSPFWFTAAEMTFLHWEKRIAPDAKLLDVGCADGRCAFRFAEPGRTMVALDISKRMVERGIRRARHEGKHGHMVFMVADGVHLPFRAGAFDGAFTYGVLHHLPDPGTSTREIQRILKPRGIHFGSENNRSVFRGLFDLSMKAFPLWHEEAGDQPLISSADLRKWTDGLPADRRVATHVFLPPHLFNPIGRKLAWGLMAASDGTCLALPWLKHQGGLIVFEIEKTAGA
ncbi:MAG: class I SAM-dependent methyltransferase [Planctomycetota bacterium]|nr:class I SAM-dependent methyltransferase [Planctomycetota bacterium]